MTRLLLVLVLFFSGLHFLRLGEQSSKKLNMHDLRVNTRR